MVKNVSRLILFLVLVAGFVPSFSQVFHLNGWVRDHESGVAIEDVTVYINGTTQGSIPENTMVFSNSIGEKGVAYMLPEDYIPSMQ